MRCVSRIVAIAATFLFIAGMAVGGAVYAGEIKIVCIGDSITAGRYYNWRYHLSLRLAREGYSQLRWVGSQRPTVVDYRGDYPDAHEGYYGANAEVVLHKSEAIIEKEHPDIAVIHLGTNDISQKKNAEHSAGQIGAIIDNLRKANPKVKVFVCLIPHPGGPGAFNRALRAMVDLRQNSESPLFFVDLNAGWNNQPDQDTYDWVHPNLRGTLNISDRLHEVLVKNMPAPESAPTPEKVEKLPTNLAAGRPVRASAESGAKASLAVDGNAMTMWEATPVWTQPLIKPEDIAPQWLEVDLGKSVALGGTGIIWDMAGASYDYTLAVSDDQTNWKMAVAKTNNVELSVSLKPELDRFAAQGRYVRVTVDRVPNVNFPNYRTGLPAAIREFQVYAKEHQNTKN